MELIFWQRLIFHPYHRAVGRYGTLVGWLVGALEGAAVGGAASAFVAALSTIGIPKDSIIHYELDVKAGKFLVLADGTADIIEHARVVLGTSGASRLAIHAARAE